MQEFKDALGWTPSGRIEHVWVDTLEIEDAERQIIVQEMAAFADIVATIPGLAADCGIDAAIVDKCRTDIKFQAEGLAALYDALSAPFSEYIRRRITGVTSRPGAGRRHSYAHRESEILAWVAQHGNEAQEWVALDDAEWQFDTHKVHLVVCGSFPGFDEAAEAELRAHFENAPE